MKTISQLTRERILLGISQNDELEAERALENAIFENDTVKINLKRPIHLKTLTDRIDLKKLIITIENDL